MTTPTLAEVVAFLCGEAQLDGCWFGDLHPTERGRYWWRKHLRNALNASIAGVQVCANCGQTRDKHLPAGQCVSPGGTGWWFPSRHSVGVAASEQTYYCPECGVMEGNWHTPTCSQHKQPRWLVQRPGGVPEVAAPKCQRPNVIDPYEECAQCGKFHYTHADEKHAFIRKPADGVGEVPRG